MDADTTSSRSSYEEMLGKFRRHEADILLGTQMVTKGHDFPDVTLVGVLLADASLYLDDYRAAERTFSMLTQVIGRAGRGSLAGRAVIQTNNPDSEIIRLATEQNYPTFYEREVRLRRLLCFPPTCDIALLTVSSVLESETIKASKKMADEIARLRGEERFCEVELIPFGPFEAPIYRVDNRYRMRMVIKCKLTKATLAFFHALLCAFGEGCDRRVHMSIDFNPSNL
jgi:primosomal protein N' (replication factor Y)